MRAASRRADRRAKLWALAFVACWAAVEALAAHLQRGYSPYQVVFTRYAVHLALLAAVFAWRAPATLWRTRRPAYQLARSLLMVTMPASFVVAAQRGVHPGTALAVFWVASPLLVLALARPVLGEQVPRRAWIAAALAGAAAAAACGPGPFPGARRALLPAAMAASFAGYVAMTRALRDERTRANLFYTALGPVLVLAPAMPRVWTAPSPRDLAVMVGVGALGLATLFALDRMAAAAPLSASAPVAPLQVAFAALLQAVETGRSPGAAAAVALSSVAAVSLFAWNLEPSPLAP